MRDDTGRKSGPGATAIWRRRKWIAVSIFAVIVTAAASIAFFLPDRFVGTATVLVEYQPAPDATAPPRSEDEMETRLKTLSERLLSRAQLVELIRKFNLYSEHRTQGAPAEAIIEQMRKDIKVELKGVDPVTGRGQTVAFAVSFWGDDARTAAAVAQTIAESYVEDNRRSRERDATSSARFLKAQLDAAKKRLDANSAEQAALVARRDALAKRLASMEPAGSPRSLESQRLAKLRETLTELLWKYKDNHPEVTRTRNEIRMLEAQIAAAPPERPRAYDGEAMARVRDALAAADAAILSSEYSTAHEHYLSLMKRYEAARLNANMEQGDQGVRFAILDPAVVPDEPAAPHRFRILLGGLALAIGVGIGGMVMKERLDTSFHALEDLREFTSLPILVSIPRIMTKRAKWRHRSRLFLGFSLATIVLAIVVGSSYFVARWGSSLFLMLSGSRA